MCSPCIIPEQELQEVFLSHAGKQKPFVIDLYNDFIKWPRCPTIKPFFDQSDDSLPKGEEFPELIFEAAQKCTVAVVILTKEYVTSKWPMLELLAFVKAQKTNPALKLLPVFYDGQPTSNFDDSLVLAWKAMEPKSDGKSSDRITISVDSCKEALRKLRKSNGLILTNNKSLQSLRDDIVKEVVKFLPPSCELDTENVQGCLRLCKSIHKMFQKNKRGVYCLGLYGMGGLGKSTMCKELCNYFGPSLFHRSCTLDIVSKKGSKFKRHIKILESYKYLSKEQISKFDKYQAEKCVQQCLSDKNPKFLAVDNVQEDLDSRQEAEKYLEWLSPRSFIIITSRSRDNLVSVNREIICKPFPNLKREEATTLFLRIAAPELARQPLDHKQNRIIEKCLQICFFSQKDHGDHAVNGEGSHYHPLALRALASYLREKCAEEDSILCWKKVLKDKNIVFLEDSKDNVYNVLGLGFHNMCDLSKQLFIDVALFAPSSVEKKDIFNWLVSIHHGCTPQLVGEKLRGLRRKSFLNYDNKKTKRKSSQGDDEICRNISMHDLYREFAKRYITNKDEGQFKYGVYDDGTHSPPSPQLPMWARAPRIRLQRLPTVAKVKEWSNVAVVHLIECETITTVSIGELSSLRDLTVVDCPKLEVLSWTENIATKQLWGTQLCFVNLFSNRSLRKIPDFSCCSELQEMTVEGCSNAMEPISLHTCSNLRLLLVSGNNVPEVQSIKSCPKLEFVLLAWKSTHNGLPLLEDLHGLSELRIKGPSDAAFDQMDCFTSLPGEKQFWKQLPKDSLCYTLPGAGVLGNLKNVELTSIPLGNLPEKLAAAGSSLQNLILNGCLLSETVDFSAFPNLVTLKIRWTNVQEVRGLEHLKKLTYLDCNFCFRLQKVPDLRPLSELKHVFFLQCSMLHGIPRLPTGCIREYGSSEDELRAILASLAYAKTTPKPLPLPGFGINGGNGSIPSHVDGGWAIHMLMTCDGCMIFPLVGRRYRPKPVRTQYDLCSGCFSKKCYCTEKSNARWKAEGKLKLDYDLCSACYARSRCDLRDFYQIDESSLPDQVSQPRLTVSQEGPRITVSQEGPYKMSISVPDFLSEVRSTRPHGRHTTGSVFSLKILSSPFTRGQQKLQITNGALEI
ncbi:hypothetical protein KC19_1G022000 [Ceratodon purpureus]|uniref:TIR domain-containing protein n=1 Tax=Ceratodon purpureus TaxID=3225 RepID=A0A8T0J2K9_CERPU|nr:hypothetical protein KC19_1G022000 [Ceratodon purpureus]